MDAFFERTVNIRLAFSLIDSRHGYLKADMDVLDKMVENNLRILTIFTKSDKLSHSVLKNQLKNHQTRYGLKVIPFPFLFIAPPYGGNAIIELIPSISISLASMIFGIYILQNKFDFR